MVAPETSSVGRWSLEPHDTSQRRSLDREARSGAVGHVAAHGSMPYALF
jgi:hypothetical protein